MTPLGAILDVANHYLRVTNLNKDRIVETMIFRRLKSEWRPNTRTPSRVA